MLCTDCKATERPTKGSPVPHYCDACGFPIAETGARVRRSEAAFLVAVADVVNEGGGCLPGTAYRDPLLTVLDAIRRI